MAKLYWTVKLGIEKSWVADGFELTAERAKDMLANDLQYANGHELSAKIISKPAKEIVRKLQGYK